MATFVTYRIRFLNGQVKMAIFISNLQTGANFRLFVDLFPTLSTIFPLWIFQSSNRALLVWRRIPRSMQNALPASLPAPAGLPRRECPPWAHGHAGRVAAPRDANGSSPRCHSAKSSQRSLRIDQGAQFRIWDDNRLWSCCIRSNLVLVKCDHDAVRSDVPVTIILQGRLGTVRERALKKGCLLSSAMQ